MSKQNQAYYLKFGGLFFLYMVLSLLELKATHIRAGEITAERINKQTLTYKFTFTGFRDSGSNIQFGSGKFNFGDGNSIEANFQIDKFAVSAEVEMVRFSVTHTYDAANSYVVSYKEEYRNDAIINMDNSVNTAFYVESLVVIDPFFGTNSTPILTVPPIDYAAVGEVFIHNAGAFDPDGDSLSYRFTTPKQSRNSYVNNYRKLNATEFYDNYAQGNSQQSDVPGLTINPSTGDLIWDAPGQKLNQGDRAEYNVAFVIEEWRYVSKIDRWERLGFVVRDMQIIVEKTDNEPPEINLPENVCVEAGTEVNLIIEGTDPDGDPVRLEAYGGPFEVDSPAEYSPVGTEFFNPPTYMTFNWKTVCEHVRERPYQVQVKVIDDPEKGPSLVNFATLEVTVVAPAPTGLTATTMPGRSMQLNWDKYECENADSIQIWRRVGNYEIEPDNCEVGMPGNAGYQLIDKMPVNEVSYLDNDHGVGLAPGANYCYRLVAEFNPPSGGLSYVSEEACDSLLVTAPVITNVDVKATDIEDGEILVKWTPPYEIDQSLFPPAYSYDLMRAEAGSADFEIVLSQSPDTVFVDAGLNTFGKRYNYYVKAYDVNDIYIDSSALAGPVRLELKPLLQSIRLNWSADVPWSNTLQSYPYHYIYRDQVSSDEAELVLIDSIDVNVAGFSYLDDGRFNDVMLDDQIEYCYYVVTQGSYDTRILPEPLLNASQIACGQPNDTIPPCTPLELVFEEGASCEDLLADVPCGASFYRQEIVWEDIQDTECGEDVVYFNVYLSETGEEEDYEVVGTSTTNSILREDLTSIKGCYRITAVDRSGNESDPTDEVCLDNCPVYKLPNVFTPNGDGVNDVFAPLNNIGLGIGGFDNANCPRFVKSVNFKVVDRAGFEVFNYDSFENPNGIFINWDGKDLRGNDVPSGVYYYSAEVVFDVFDPKDANQELKGWIHVLR